jgi:hypothetical protein
MQEGRQIKNWAAHGGGALGVAFAHDGRLASSGRDHAVKIWKSDGALEKQCDGLTDIALRVAFDHEGKQVVAGDWNGVVKLWSAADGKVVGDVALNPPKLADRLASAEKRVAELKPAADAATQARATAEADAAAAQPCRRREGGRALAGAADQRQWHAASLPRRRQCVTRGRRGGARQSVAAARDGSRGRAASRGAQRGRVRARPRRRAASRDARCRGGGYRGALGSRSRALAARTAQLTSAPRTPTTHPSPPPRGLRRRRHAGRRPIAAALALVAPKREARGASLARSPPRARRVSTKDAHRAARDVEGVRASPARRGFTRRRERRAREGHGAGRRATRRRGRGRAALPGASRGEPLIRADSHEFGAPAYFPCRIVRTRIPIVVARPSDCAFGEK